MQRVFRSPILADGHARRPKCCAMKFGSVASPHDTGRFAANAPRASFTSSLRSPGIAGSFPHTDRTPGHRTHFLAPRIPLRRTHPLNVGSSARIRSRPPPSGWHSHPIRRSSTPRDTPPQESRPPRTPHLPARLLPPDPYHRAARYRETARGAVRSISKRPICFRNAGEFPIFAAIASNSACFCPPPRFNQRSHQLHTSCGRLSACFSGHVP